MTSVNPDRVGGLGEKARASLLFESFTVKSLSTGFLALFTPVFRSALLFSLFTAIIMVGNSLALKDLLSINGLVHKSASDWGNNLATCSLIEWWSTEAIVIFSIILSSTQNQKSTRHNYCTLIRSITDVAYFVPRDRMRSHILVISARFGGSSSTD